MPCAPPPGRGDRSVAAPDPVGDQPRARQVKGCAKNLLDVDITLVPPDLKEIAIRLILVSLKNRLEIPLTELEQTLFRSDEAYLRRVAACEIPIAQPANPVEGETQVVSGTPMIRDGRTVLTTASRRAYDL